MAKGLRKLIKNANRFSNNSLTRRLQARRLGGRLRVEELEDRIAPAAVDLTAGAFVAWDTAAGGTDETFDADDGIIGLGSNTTAGITVTVADVTGAAGDDSATLNLSVTADTAGAVDKTIYIYSNKEIGTISLSGLSADTTAVNLVVVSGNDMAAAAGGNIALGGGAGNLVLASQVAVANTITVANGDDFAATANTGIGAISFGSVTTANMPVRMTLTTNGTGALGAITSTDADIDMSSEDGAIAVTAGSIGAINWAGDLVIPGANGITFTATDSSIGSLSFGSISTAGTGDILFTATDTDGTIGNITSATDIMAGNAGSTIQFLANDGIGNMTATTGSIGGTAGAITFNGNADNTTDGDVGNISAGDKIGDSGATVTFTGENLGTINAPYIGAGAGAVTFTADDPDDADGGTAAGQINVIGGSTTLIAIGGGAGGVTFNADDGFAGGQTLLTTAGSIANGANVTFNTNQDANDDTGSMFAVTAGTDIGATGAGTLVINTNGNAGDNGTQRAVGAITANGGFARVDITADGAVGLVTVQGGDAVTGNDLEIVIDTAAADADNNKPTNAVDFAGINVAATSVNDSVTVTGASEISGRIWNAGANGSIIAGDGLEGTDLVTLNADVIIYNGDDTLDGAIDANYSASLPFQVMVTSGGSSGNGELYAAVRNASPLLTAVFSGETFSVDASTTPVTATLTFDPDDNDGGAGVNPTIAIDDLAGSGLGAATELKVMTSGDTDFDVAQITRASNFGSNPNLKLISIEGDLYGDIGEVASEFGTVEIIVIAGDASAGGVNTFYGTGIKGLAPGLDADTSEGGGADAFSDLTMGPNVVVSVLNREVSEPLTLPGTIQFQWAGFGSTVFNHHIIVVGGEAIVYGIDGDSAAANEYELAGTGDSGAAIDPAGVFAAGTYAMINRIALTDIDGLSTDVSVREVDGSTSGSWLEFETNVGLVNLTTQLDSISVGIEDGGDAVDNAVSTSINGSTNTRADFDRLGGGEFGGNKVGLNPATEISDATAAMGNFIVRSMGTSVANNINVVVTGNSGPITLTGKSDITTPDHGDLVVNANAPAAAIAIGGNLAGAITIPGAITGGAAGSADILIGIAIDANNDGDWVDTGETPSGSVLANITIGDAGDTDILVADDILADIVVTGADQDPENLGLELDGNLNGVKAGNIFGTLGTNVLVVAGSLEYVIADGPLNSGIFSGGQGDDTVEIEGVGIFGPGVIGAAEGVTDVFFIDHEIYGDAADMDYIYVDSTGMTIQWVAGAFTDTADVLGDVYLQDDLDELVVTTDNGDGMDIGDIFILSEDDMDIYSISDIGVAVAADDAVIPGSEALQDLITTTYDVVYSPTELDTEAGDFDGLREFNGEIWAQNAGGVVAEGDVDVTADIAGTFGYIVSLNGSIYGDVHSGVSIGYIVASNDIDGEFISEGTLALVGPTNLASEIQTSYGLIGVPSWFNGGILAEAGDIGSNNDMNAGLDMNTNWGASGENEAVFTAAGTPTQPQNVAFWNAPAMGTIYVPAGGMSADINVGGSFGGIQVPAGECWVELTVPGYIGKIVAPQFNDNGGNADSFWDAAKVGINLTNGETVVVAGAPLYADYLNVVVTGADTIAVVEDYDVELIGGLAAGASLTVDGDLDSLTFGQWQDVTASGLVLTDGNWAGAVVVNGYLGDVTSLGSIDDIIVQGTIAASATLDAYNFNSLDAKDATAVTSGGTLTYTNKIDTITNLNGNTQTLFLGAAKNVSATYTTVFGKVTSVVFTGTGNADFVSVLGAPTEKDLKKMANKHNVTGAATAHVGGITMNGSSVKLDDIVINGESSVDIKTPGTLNDLFIAGDAGDISAYQINKMFIGGSAGDITARIMNNTTVMGDVDTIGAYSMNKVKVFGDAEYLFLTSNAGGPANHAVIKNSYIQHADYTNFDPSYPESNVRVIKTYIGGLEENAENPTVVVYGGYYS